MKNTWLSSRNVCKLGCGLLLLFLSFFIPSAVYAGELNAAEARVVSAARGTFEYEGKQYRAEESYINQLIALLNQDDIDLTSEDADELIGQMYASVEEGVNSGYLYEVKEATEEAPETTPSGEEDESENVPTEQEGETETATNHQDDVTQTVPNHSSDGTKDQGVPSQSESSTEQDQTSDEDQTSMVSQESTSEARDQQVFKAAGYNLGNLKYMGLCFWIIVAGMLSATILLKRTISRGEHGKQE